MTFADELSNINKGEAIDLPIKTLNETISYFKNRCMDAARQGCKNFSHEAEVFDCNPDSYSETCDPAINYDTYEKAQIHLNAIEKYLEKELHKLGFKKYEINANIERRVSTITYSFFRLIKREYGVYYRIKIIYSAWW